MRLQVVTRGFSYGQIEEGDYASLMQLDCVAAIIDSEVLHRGAAVHNLDTDWGSSCSIELCSGLGWDAWSEHSTGGTQLPWEESELQAYSMLMIHRSD